MQLGRCRTLSLLPRTNETHRLLRGGLRALFTRVSFLRLPLPPYTLLRFSPMIAAPTQRRSPALAPLSLYLISLQGALVAGRATPSSFFVSPPNCGAIRSSSNSRAGDQRRGLDSCAGGWNLRSSSRPADERNAGEEGADNGSSSFPDTLGQDAPLGVSPETWERVLRSARDRKAEDERLSPNPKHLPSHVAAVTLQALRQNDVPYPNFGCEVAIRFASTSNPASGFTPGGLRTYLDDPSMPFYRILGDWDEMGPVGDAEVDGAETGKANQQIRVRMEGDPAWSTVYMDFVKEEGCWLIERLWIDDKSVAGGRSGEGAGSLPPPLTMAELFDEDRLEMMGCRLADYDPARLAAEGGEWLEEYPNPSLSPKAVALTCLISLRQNDDGSKVSGSSYDDTEAASGETAAPAAGAAAAQKPPLNQGCEHVIRFCSPSNVASTLTPAHFAQYLNDPWYAIFKEWDELSFHSEQISADGGTANLVVLLRPKDEEAWTSVNWDLVMCDGMWLTERIWVVDV